MGSTGVQRTGFLSASGLPDFLMEIDFLMADFLMADFLMENRFSHGKSIFHEKIDFHDNSWRPRHVLDTVSSVPAGSPQPDSRQVQ